MSETIYPRFGTACVLAGGRGRRMEGRDKLLLNFAGERLLIRIARQLGQRFSDLVAVTSRPEAFGGLGYRVVSDSFEEAGPLAGLHAGLKTARSEWIYLVACDMPFFSAAWVDELVRGIEEAGARGELPVAAAAMAGPFFEPFHAFYKRSLLNDIDEAMTAGGRPPSIQSLVRARSMVLADTACLFLGADSLFLNVNTPEDLAYAEASAKAAGLAGTVSSDRGDWCL